MEGIKCTSSMALGRERNIHGEKVRAVLRYLVTAIGRPANFKTLMARPRLESLGHDAPPSPSPRPLRYADGGWRCRSLCASLCSCASLHFACQFRMMNNSAPSSTRRNHLPAFCAVFRYPLNFTPKTDTSSFR